MGAIRWETRGTRPPIFSDSGDIIKGVRKGKVLGLNPPLEHDILQNFITYAKEINCFRILFAC